MKVKTLSKAVLAGSVMAGMAQVAMAAPTLGEVLGASEISATGYVDVGYYHFDTDSALYNAFDTQHDTFDLKQASLTIASQPKEGVGALVNLTAGSNADPIASTPTNSTDNFDITQAFVQYATGSVTLIAGKYVTLAGAEVIAPTSNVNISHSLAFFNAIPYSHTGARAVAVPVEGLTLTAGINNGWDTQKDTNSGKTVEVGVSYAPMELLSVAVQAYSGDEPTGNGNVDTRTLLDAVVTVKPMKELALVLNYDMGKQNAAGGVGTGDAKWNALVGYANYQLTEQFRTSLRLEQFDDKDGYRLGGGKQKVKEATLTVGYAPSAKVEFRGEVRQDKSDAKSYTKDLKATDKQQYFALEALYKF